MAVMTCTTQGMNLLTAESDAYKEKLEVINKKLSRLPDPQPCSAPWTMGYRCPPLETADDELTIELFFEKAEPVDLIVLMPAAHADTGNALNVVGFPEHFYIERLLSDGKYEVIADYREKDYLVYGLEPQLFTCPDRKPITGIRLTITRAPLVQTLNKKLYMTALNEFFAFAGQKNVALNTEIEVTQNKWTRNVWDKHYLVDGFFLFIPTDNRFPEKGKDSRYFSNRIELLYDLGSVQPIDELRLWPTMGAGDFHHPFSGGTSFPADIQLQLLTAPQDPAPQTIYKYQSRFLRPGATPFMQRIPTTHGRYFKLIIENGFPDFQTAIQSKIILNEVEFLHQGIVLTQGLSANFKIIDPYREKSSYAQWLTDGLVGSGKIIPLREWLEKFHLQRQLTRERKLLRAVLQKSLNKEKEHVRVLAISGSALIVLLALMIWVSRLLSKQRWSRMREQIACDLHDEIGANVSSIAHSSEMAKELVEQDQRDLLNQLLDRIIDAARLTADETRNFIQFLEGRDTGLELPGQIRGVAHKILGNIDYTCTFHSARPFTNLNPARKWDLLFFVKEALNNVLKHAEADQVEILTRKKGRSIQLIITDNGQGIAQNQPPPRHLQSRARRLKGELAINSGPDQGTQILLTLPKRNS